MARLIAALIRHGDYFQLPDTPSAHQPFPLKSAGEAQAGDGVKCIQEACDQQRWTPDLCIDSSRLLRAWQTAQIIGEGLTGMYAGQFRVESFDVLAERSMGSAANLTIDQIQEIIYQDPRFADPPSDWKSNSYYCLPLQGAESLMQAGERVACHLSERMIELQKTIGRDTLKLFVGHGAAFRHAAFHLGVLEFGQLAKLSMHYARPVFLEFLSDHSWRHVGGEWKVRKGGDTVTD